MQPAVEMRDVRVSFGKPPGEVRALDRLSLRVEPGSVFGFLGPNGAGKTTAMHVLLGFVAADSGDARLFGEDVRRSIARRRIGYLPEHPDTYRFLTGTELLMLTGRLFGIQRAALKTRVGEALETVGLTDAARRRIATYSRGMMQRICLAQSLINDPDLVILDEPTGGLDPIGRREIRQVIAGLRERGKTVFFSSHELSEVELVCDTLAIVCNGRIAAQGRTDELVGDRERLESFFMRVVQEAGGA